MTPDQAHALRVRWQTLAGRFDLPLALYDELAGMYTAAGRHYHNLDHLAHCLDELAASPWAREDRVALALWFHDAIYDPTKKDNEERSAELAAARLAAHLPAAAIADISRLIRATRHAAPPVSLDEQVIVDVDLAILGQPPARFAAYEHAVRQEYVHVPDAAFRTGRAAILRQFLARPAIYSTPHFHRLYEHASRQNLAASLATLEAPNG
jgi:predicted metal-dependent HD superfamily phosphohydrolase